MGTPKQYLRKNWTFLLIVSLAVVFLVLLHGLLPGMIGPNGSVSGRFMLQGFMECGADSLSGVLRLKCDLVGGEVGGKMPTGAPVYILGSLLIKSLSLSPEWAVLVVSLIVMAISLLGMYGLLRSFRVKNKYVALIGSILYFTLPIIMSMQSFGGTYWGFLLLPLSIYLARIFTLNFDKSDVWRKLLIAAAWVLLFTTHLLIDGYSFFMLVSFTAALLIFWGVVRLKDINTWLVGITFLISVLIAFLFYKLAVPGSGSWSAADIDLVRAMGLDLATILHPSTQWWAEFIDTGIKPGILWGDGLNSAYNYAGISLIILAIIGIYLSLKHKDKKNKAQAKIYTLEILALLAIMISSLILSMGPSVKINTQRGPLASPITYKSYLMPEDDGVLSLHTDVLYRKLPGLKSMRATYRWHIVTQLTILIFAAIAIDKVMKRKGVVWGSVLIGVIVLEMAPNPFVVVRQASARGAQIDKFDIDVVRQLDAALDNEATVLFYPNAVGGNDYLANYIAPMIDINTYNVGNDKAVELAKGFWPNSIRTLLELKDGQRNGDQALIKEAFAKGLVDAVVVPKFDLRWDSYSWPPKSKAGSKRAAEVVSRLEATNDYNLEYFEYFTVVSVRE